MPQMSPMMWLTLMTLTSIVMMQNSSMTMFNLKKKKKNNK
nr:ATP synthase F0 subunit 8 [Caliscelis rhabdocladis]WQB38572.1 ATP synthase F0 subunit 8 [Caliscelis rhabdocladis]